VKETSVSRLSGEKAVSRKEAECIALRCVTGCWKFDISSDCSLFIHVRRHCSTRYRHHSSSYLLNIHSTQGESALGSTGIRYDTIEEFNLDSKAECGQLNLAHV